MNLKPVVLPGEKVLILLQEFHQLILEQDNHTDQDTQYDQHHGVMQ